jgi:c-di-GMP-binding flagellar brake protein YcgR
MFEPPENVEVAVLPDGPYLSGAIRYADKQHIIISCRPKDFAQLQPGMSVQLTQVAEGERYDIETAILRCHDNCIVVPMRTPKLVQRRRSPRIPCRLTARYSHALVPNLDKMTGLRGKGRAIVRDISVGGARVCLDRMLPAHTCCDIEIELGDMGIVTAKAHIVRCTPMSGPQAAKYDNMPFAVALKFEEMSRHHQVLIQKFTANPPDVKEKED